MKIAPKTEESDPLPFLVRNACPRINAPELPGYYSKEHDLWVIDTPEGEIALITYSAALAELSTKTKTIQEEDDELTGPPEFGPNNSTYVHDTVREQVRILGLMELVTKTETVTEKDDEISSLNSLVE